jgi:hypothetical protein
MLPTLRGSSLSAFAATRAATAAAVAVRVLTPPAKVGRVRELLLRSHGLCSSASFPFLLCNTGEDPGDGGGGGLDASAADQLLSSYESERRPHVRAYIETAIRLGKLMNTCQVRPLCPPRWTLALCGSS